MAKKLWQPRPFYKTKAECQKDAIKLLSRGLKVKISKTYGGKYWQVGVY